MDNRIKELSFRRDGAGAAFECNCNCDCGKELDRVPTNKRGSVLYCLILISTLDDASSWELDEHSLDSFNRL